MDQREMDAINPGLYREARSAILGDEPEAPAPEPVAVEPLDKNSDVPDNTEEQPASGNEEHADTPAESDTPDEPGPEQPELSPPPKTRFAGREFDNLEQAELSYKEQQARATRAEQRLAELERQQAQRDTQRQILAPIDQLTQDEYARLEQEAAKYDMDVRAYRGMVRREAELLAAKDQEHLATITESHITSHPQFETDRDYVAKALESDPYLLTYPDGLSRHEAERLLTGRLDALFRAAAKERLEREHKAREDAIKRAAISEHEKKQAVARQSASTEASASKAAAPSQKPVAPGDAGDELIAMFRERNKRNL